MAVATSTIIAVAAVAAVAAAGVTAYAQYEAGQQQSEALKYNAKIAEQNANQARQVAEYEAVIAEQNAAHALAMADYNAAVDRVESATRENEAIARKQEADFEAQVAEMRGRSIRIETERAAAAEAERGRVALIESDRLARQREADAAAAIAGASIKERAVRRKGELAAGTALTRAAAGGGEVGEGSPLMVALDAARDLEMTALEERYLGDVAASADLSDAALARFRGTSAAAAAEAGASLTRFRGDVAVAGTEAERARMIRQGTLAERDVVAERAAGKANIEATLYEGGLQARGFRLDATRIRFGGLSQSSALIAQSRLYRFQAAGAARAGTLAAGSTLLSGAASATSIYAKRPPTTTPQPTWT